MSSVHYEKSKKDDEEPVDLGDMANLQVDRPSDHYNMYRLPPRSKKPLTRKLFENPLATAFEQLSRVSDYVLGPIENPESFQPSPRDLSGDSFKEPEPEMIEITLPSLPSIENSRVEERLRPLGDVEFIESFVNSSLVGLPYRVFLGGIANDALRRRIWPYLLGLTDSVDEFDWSDYETQFNKYTTQWKSISADQESRFFAYHERKSLIERDVIRIDRRHSFYSDANKQNIDKLNDILMAYVMHDFDTGYVQGMSDIASPLLYLWKGDTVKAFWHFAKIMDLIKMNFESTLYTVDNCLNLLMKLVKLTDPIFGQYLESNNAIKCSFAFQWLICLFKREVMKEETDGYDNCLLIWEILIAYNVYMNEQNTELTPSASPLKLYSEGSSPVKIPTPCSGERSPKLSNVNLFILCISLAIIRRERDVILGTKMGTSGIVKHFNDLKLNDGLEQILQDATNISYWLRNDGGERQMYQKDLSYTTDEDFDILNDNPRAESP